MLNSLFRNNGKVVSSGKGFGSVLFPCESIGVFLRTDTIEEGVSWWGCGNYGWNVYHSDTYQIYADGNCGEYSELIASYQAEEGHVFYDTGCCLIRYDGGTGYYFEDNCCVGCDPYGTYLRTEGCNDIYADGCCGEYSQDNGSCDHCDGCDPDGTYLRTEGCDDIYADGCCGEYSVDNGSCDPCYGCELAGTYLRTEGCTNFYADGCCGEIPETDLCCGCDPAGTLIDLTSTPWAGTIDSDGTDWNIYSIEFTFADGCCGTYLEKHWYADYVTPLELSSPDEGISPNPPSGYVLTASAVYPLDGIDSYTYATYADDPMWHDYRYLIDTTGYGGNYPWQSRKIFADGSGGYYAEQTVQDAGTVMSDLFAADESHARFYATGITFNDGTNGIHPSFDIISCSAFGGNPTPHASGVDWRIEITLESLGILYYLRVGTLDQDEIDDGQCGRTVMDVSFTPEPVSTLLYDETISSYYYYSDGAGGYYTEFYG